MNNKYVSLMQLSNLVNDYDLSCFYVRYIAGLSSKREYKHQEIKDISRLIKYLDLSFTSCEGFIYGYTVPHLNKEFDLIKITKEYVLNIELKSAPKDLDSITKQLRQNTHYLKLLNKDIKCFTFVSSNKHLYKLENNVLVKAEREELKDLCAKPYIDNIDLDLVFSVRNILVSPFNDTLRFINNDYLLTENQENIKKRILKTEKPFKIGLTGGPGTGKTLLIYDIAKDLAKLNNVLIIQNSQVNQSHKRLESYINNLSIIDEESIDKINYSNIDYILIDEAERLRENIFDFILNKIESNNINVIFSYDYKQRLTYEDSCVVIDKIEEIINSKEKLTMRIRLDKDLALFITYLKDLNKYDNKTKFKNIHIYYEPKKERVIDLIKSLDLKGYKYIPFDNTYINDIDYLKDYINSYTVIRGEFDKVVMTLDSNFYYLDDKLKSKPHPDLRFSYMKLLYQGITRVRNELAFIITSKELFKKISILFKED